MLEMIISKKIVLSKWEKPKPSKYLMLEGKRDEDKNSAKQKGNHQPHGAHKPE